MPPTVYRLYNYENRYKGKEGKSIQRYCFLGLLALTVLTVSALSACAELGYDDSDIPSGEVRPGQLSLVGASKGDLSEYNTGVFGDVAGYKSLAFVGKWREDCPGTGADIIDISQPSAPIKLSDTNDYPETSMEDMEAIEIDGQDILVIGLQNCANDSPPRSAGAALSCTI